MSVAAGAVRGTTAPPPYNVTCLRRKKCEQSRVAQYSPGRPRKNIPTHIMRAVTVRARQPDRSAISWAL